MREIDGILAEVKRSLPNVQISQLTVTHPADDDGVWFFKLPSDRNEVQIESSTGHCPFLIEHHATGDNFTGLSISEVVRKVVELIQLSDQSTG